MGNKSVKKRNWCFVLYPDSLPVYWEDIILKCGIPFALSPLHDADFNPATAEAKKPHYHAIGHWDGPTTYSTAKALADMLGGPVPLPCESVRGAYRYFTHQDNPEKAQYDAKDIRVFNGFSIGDFVELTRSEEDKLSRQLCDIITGREITEYSQLIDYLIESDQNELFSVASRKTLFLREYIKGKWRAGVRDGDL